MTNPSNLFTVNVAKGAAPFDSSPTLTDITSRIRRITLTAGRMGPYGSFPARSCAIEGDDSDAGFNGFDDVTVVPNIPVEVDVVAGATARRRFTGYLDGDSIVPRHPEAVVMGFTASDLTKFVARETNLGLGAVPEERTSDRFERVLDAIGVPASLRDIDIGSRYMVARDLNIDAASALTACAVTDGPLAAWFVDREGRVRFDGRHCYRTRSQMASHSGTFSTDPVLQEFFGAHKFARPLLSSVTEQHLYTAVRVTNANGDVADLTTGAKPYLRYPDTTTESRLDPTADAQMVLDLFSSPQKYLHQITIQPAGDDATLAFVAGLDLRDRIQVHYEPVNGGADITKNCTIEQISETVGVGELYTVTLTLFPTDPMDGLNTDDWLLIGTDSYGTGWWAP